MNVLIIFGQPLVTGGHFKSGRSLGSALMQRGHRISFLMPCDLKNKFRLRMFAELGSTVHVLKRNYISGKNKGARIVAEVYIFIRILVAVILGRTDIILCQDEIFSRSASWLALITRRKVVVTHPGGAYRYMCVPAFAPLIVYSKELLEAYTKDARYSEHKAGFHYVRGRIDTDNFSPVDSMQSVMFGAAPTRKGVLTCFMAIRLHPHKMPWINSMFKMALVLEENAVSADLIVAGDGVLLEELISRSEDFNCKNSHVKIYFIGAVLDDHNLADMMRSSSLVFGNGRGLMEAMACGKPVVILGEDGNGELVSADNIEYIAHWNFSGRHLRDTKESAELSELVLKLHENYDQVKNGTTELLDYVKKELSFKRGAEQLEELFNTAHTPKFKDVFAWEKMRNGFRKELRS